MPHRRDLIGKAAISVTNEPLIAAPFNYPPQCLISRCRTRDRTKTNYIRLASLFHLLRLASLSHLRHLAGLLCRVAIIVE